MTTATQTIETLRERVAGPVLAAGDDGYDAERAGFQTALEHRPDAVVGATNADDVRAAIELAGAMGLPVAVQATGHGLSIPADGGLLITTRRMTDIRIDPETRTAWVGAGVRSHDLVEAAARHGLAPLTGSAADVGVVSYILAGGVPLLARRYGYAADRVRAVDVVTADGTARHVTADREPDLFWALRGAASNLGVVTGLEVELVPLSRLYGGGMYFDVEVASELLRAYHEWTTTLPDEMSSSLGLVPLPDVPFIPEPLRGRHVGHVRIAYAGDAEAGERLIAPLREVGPRLVDEVREMPYTAGPSIYNDPPQPHGFYGSNLLLRGLATEALQAIVDLAGPDAPVPCVVELRHLGGALSRPPAVTNAVGHRDAAYMLRVLSPTHGTDLDAVRSTHARVFDAMARWSTGGRRLNFIYGEAATPEQVRSAYDADDYRRLVELKARYDPANLFRFNHNIAPQGSG